MTEDPPAREPRTARQRRTRGRLVRAAVSLLLEGRLEASSLDDIAAQAGHTDGAVGAHFPSKAAVIAAVLDVVYVEVIERLRAVPIDTSEQLVAVVSTWAFQATTHPAWIQAEFTLHGTTVERAISLHRLAAVLGGWLAEAAERIGAGEVDSEAIASMLLSVLAGLPTLHPEPADLTIEMLRRHVALALHEITDPRGRPR